jgi:predicted GNAT family N-acyltransferase
MVFEGLTFKVAAGEDRLRAVEFRNRIYEQEFGDAATDELEAHAFYLVACKSAGEVVATFRLVEERPFEVERHIDLGAIFAPSRYPAELGRLCVQPEWRRSRQPTFLLVGMLKLAIEFAQHRGITDFVIGALGNLRNFYGRALFKPLGLSYLHPVGGVLHVMRLDLIALRADHGDSTEPFFRLLLGDPPTNIIA